MFWGKYKQVQMYTVCKNFPSPCNCETQMCKRTLGNMFWLFLSTSLHDWFPIIHGFCSKYLFFCCFSISSCSENALCTNSMWNLSSDTCSFHSGTISCSFKKYCPMHRCFIDVFFSTEKSDFCFCRNFRYFKMEIYRFWTVFQVLQSCIYSHCSLVICVITKLITCMKWVVHV